MARCSSCNAPVIWATTTQGKRMPLDARPSKRIVGDLRNDEGEHVITAARVVDTYTSHFATCPHAEQHRRKGVTS